ncbi:Rtt106 protein [Saccharomycopsis crataegensis]|uniref:Histone chaperone RTT106 n=1 Tax=Saccharomycopsis crataegensis TaxID=43959 RepID=A0AAV5QHE3_9ASCO|nr:Rtt106 protein [Saccharomycopsis crataegensis]
MSFLETLPPDLKEKIVSVIRSNPESIDAFNSLYFHAVQAQAAIANDGTNKRRKLAGGESDPVTIDKQSTILLLPKLSFQSPIRKKLNLVFSLNKSTQKPVLAIIKDEGYETPELVLTNLTTTNIRFSAFLPVPEKPKLQCLVLFYEENLGSKYNNDPLILNFNHEALVKDLMTSKVLSASDKNYKNRIIRQASICGFKIDDPFINHDSFFVDAHKGTKEGTLYFLPTNIIFGFKKPILLFDSKDIKSITYSSITRITFNITLLVSKHNSETGEVAEERIEFSMIDQAEFSKIDGYIKAKEVVDNSMAEELKAKPVLVSKNRELENPLKQDVVGILQEEPANDSDDEDEDGTYQIGEEEDEDDSDESYGSDDGGEDDGDDSDSDSEEEEEEEEENQHNE